MSTQTTEQSTCPYPGDDWTSEPQQTKEGAAARLIEHLIAAHVPNCPEIVESGVKTVTGRFK